MDLIYERTNRDDFTESGYLTHFEADFDISSDIENYTNSFQIRMALPKTEEELLFKENEISCKVFCDNTEFGGEISGMTLDRGNNEVIYTGRTWRGMQDQYIIEPPAGQDYLVVSGTMQNCLQQFPMNPIIQVGAATQNVTSHRVNRYVKTSAGIDRLLGIYGLVDTYEYSDTTGVVTMTVAEPRDLKDWIDLSADYGDHVRLKISRNGNTPRHLICLGQGELRDREVIHLYAGPPNWAISQTAVAGAYPVETYDNTSTNTLLQDGTKHYKELIANHRQIEADIYDLDVHLSDIISARDHLLDEYVEAEISQIVWQCKNYGDWQDEAFQYKTKVRA